MTVGHKENFPGLVAADKPLSVEIWQNQHCRIAIIHQADLDLMACPMQRTQRLTNITVRRTSVGRTDGRTTDGRRTDDGPTTDEKNSDEKIPTKKFRRKNSNETIWTKKNWGQGTGARHGRCGGKARVINGDSWGAKPTRPPQGARHGQRRFLGGQAPPAPPRHHFKKFAFANFLK